MTDNVQPAALSVQDTAIYLCLGVSTVYELIDSGKLVARRYGRKLLILKTDADVYLASLPVYEKVA